MRKVISGSKSRVAHNLFKRFNLKKIAQTSEKKHSKLNERVSKTKIWRAETSQVATKIIYVEIKHNIAAVSLKKTFGWYFSLVSDNPNKIRDIKQLEQIRVKNTKTTRLKTKRFIYFCKRPNQIFHYFTLCKNVYTTLQIRQLKPSQQILQEKMLSDFVDKLPQK